MASSVAPVCLLPVPACTLVQICRRMTLSACYLSSRGTLNSTDTLYSPSPAVGSTSLCI